MNIKTIFSKFSLPKKGELRTAVKSFSKQRKIIFLCFLCLCFVSGVALFSQVAIQPFQEKIPVFGGDHKEGIVGSPRFINPVLSFSNVDKDIESLVFSGLTKKNMDGTITLDLAEDFSVSQDNLVYTFTISENARFHDGKMVTAQDIVFTIQKIQDPEIKSPKQVLWEGVSVEAIDDRRVRFVLKQPFISFLENTSIGILPMHLWERTPSLEFAFSPLNIEPVGSGKYKVKNVKKNQSSVEQITLKSYRHYAGNKPYLKKIYLYFFKDDTEAIRSLKNNRIDAIAGLSPESINNLPSDTVLYTATLHRMFGLFFNQKEHSPVQERAVRQAIDIGIDREDIVRKGLYGFGTPIKSPLPPYIETNNPYRNTLEQNTEAASSLLSSSGWTMTDNGTRYKNGQPLEITIATASIPELQRVAEILQTQLKDLGIRVIIQSFSINDLNQNIIRPRNFEVLLFGNMLNQEGDIFAFWHSSQTGDPGLNIASYKNNIIDRVLERILQTFDINQRANLYIQFENEFFKDMPALFMYSPEFIYAVHGKIQNITLSPITNSSQRFLDIDEWYKETNYVIPTFKK